MQYFCLQGGVDTFYEALTTAVPSAILQSGKCLREAGAPDAYGGDMKSLTTLLISLLLAGCASAPPAPPVPFQLFNDAAFSPPSEAIGAGDLFALSPDMHAYLNSATFRAQIRAKGPEHGLVDALYKHGELKLEYESTITRNAAQAFKARSGNCMSLVIMTAAFAKELGLNVHFQNVAVDETWRRSGDLYLASSHVNLSLAKSRANNIRNYETSEQALTIDFLPPQDMTGYRTTPLEEDAIVAMYMNNRAIESLLQNRVDNAYWWARAAVTQNPSFVVAYNTLGVIYQRHGDEQQAERTFRMALEREPENLPVMQNLAPLLALLGKHEESQALTRRVAAIEPNPPFHFFKLGMKAMERKDYQAAKTMFAREVQRAPYYDEFHFWLGVAWLRLGETAKANEQIALALESSTTGDGRALYSAKLEHLRAQDPRRGRTN
jgi:Tfp pilus assembly protein PilF